MKNTPVLAFALAVYNTLAPHLLTLPTRYRGDTRSGIPGSAWLTTER